MLCVQGSRIFRNIEYPRAGGNNAECAHALCETRATVALHGVCVQDVEHLKGQFVFHYLAVFEGPIEDSDPVLAVLRLELAPEAVSSLGDRIQRRGRFWNFRGACLCGWPARLRMLLCEGGGRAKWSNSRRRRRNHSRLPRGRLLVLANATLLVLLAAATRTGIIASVLHGSPS